MPSGRPKRKPPKARCSVCGNLVYLPCKQCEDNRSTLPRPYQSAEDADIELELPEEQDERRRQLLAAISAMKRANIANAKPRSVPIGRLMSQPTAFRRLLNERRV